MDKAALRRSLIDQRLNLPDRLQRADALQQVMRFWLIQRPDSIIGAYWPIKGSSTRCQRFTGGRKMASYRVPHKDAASDCR